ncbi:thioester reductase domain-containing protein [Nocardia sp. NBC_00511]|uniref:thioester reductase domain-containing protein n=1 Tax=Nocardia sp. NBC_00511 TaxID=2903591 RepID=UPI0030E24E6A
MPTSGFASTRALRRWQVEELAEAIAAVAGRSLPGTMDVDTDFFDAGGTSIAAVELLGVLDRELDIRPDLDTVFFDARPRRLAHRWLADNPEAVAPQADLAQTLGSAVREAAMPAGTAENDPTGSWFATTAEGDEFDAAERSERPAQTGVPERLPANVRRIGGNAEAFVDTDDLAQMFADLGGADRLPLVGPVERVAPQRILLTGATGFLGSHLLLDLLRHSAAHVFCLVRADTDEDALKRLEEGLRRFSLPWSREVARRVTAVAGDLRSPRLGLDGQRWEELAAEVDSIVNAGAAVDFLRGYPSLRATNVLGPLTLAELAATGRPKPIHHVSSLAVFNGSRASLLAEDEPTANVAALPIGYDRSKWAAEAMLRRAGEHGLTVTVLRAGGIGAHPDTGAHNARDLNAGITAALMRFRTVPGFRYLNAAPVDWVSRVAAEIVCTPGAWGHTYHLTGAPTSLEQLVAETTVGGLGVRVQHWEQWCTDVVRTIREEPVPELESLAQVLQSPVARRQLAAMVTAPPASSARTDAFVAAQGLPAPATGLAARGKLLEVVAGVGTRADAEPYLRFNETLSGTVVSVDDTIEEPVTIPCDLRLALSVAGSAQAFAARTLDVRGELHCPALHPEPLTVEGTAIVRPHDGLPLRHETRHPIMHYRLALRDPDGGTWWMEGYKFAAARRQLVRQLGTQAVEIGRTGEPAAYRGAVSVPMHTYLPDQIDGIQIDPTLSERQQRLAKLLWLSWFGGQLGKSLLEPMLRVGTDLLDLRRALRKDNRR